jgi:two-component system NtrC family response regulator
MSALSSYEWPGNVRELRNVLERAMLLSRGAPITTAHLPGIAAVQKGCAAKEAVLDLDAREAAHIREVLESFGGDAKKTSEALGISLRTLYRKLERARKSV